MIHQEKKIQIKYQPGSIIIGFYSFWLITAAVYSQLVWVGSLPNIIYIYFAALFVFASCYYLIPLIINRKFSITNQTIFLNYSTLNKLCKVSITIYFLLLVLLVFWMNVLYSEAGDSLIKLRYLRFDRPLFDNFIFSAVHGWVMAFFALVSAISASLYSLIFKKNYYLYLILFFCFIESVVTLGRFPFVKVIVVYFLIASSIFGFRFLLGKVLKYVAPILYFVLIIIVIRNQLAGLSFFDGLIFALNDVLLYGISGFFIIENHLQNPSSFLHLPHSYGRSMMGIFDSFYVYVNQYMGGDAEPVSGRNGGFLREVVHISTTKNGDLIRGNAFGGWFSTLYRDGGYLWVFLASAIFALYLRLCEYISRRSNFYLFHIFFIISSSALSLFHSLIESLSIVLIILTPFLLKLLISKVKV